MVEGGRRASDSLDVSEMEESLPQTSPFFPRSSLLALRPWSPTRLLVPPFRFRLENFRVFGHPSKHNHRPTTCCLLTPSKLGGHQTAGPGPMPSIANRSLPNKRSKIRPMPQRVIGRLGLQSGSPDATLRGRQARLAFRVSIPRVICHSGGQTRPPPSNGAPESPSTNPPTDRSRAQSAPAGRMAGGGRRWVRLVRLCRAAGCLPETAPFKYAISSFTTAT
jgi:hypothetical protein